MPGLAMRIIAANGVYDLACALAILLPPRYEPLRFLGRYNPLPRLGALHHNCFLQQCPSCTPLVKRLLAYWIATYGLVRASVLCMSRPTSTVHTRLVIASYVIEATSYGLEAYKYSAADRTRALAIIILSVPFAVVASHI